MSRRHRCPGRTSLTGSLRCLETVEQFDGEKQRQDLLDQRWRRWRNMIVTFAFAIGVLTGAVPIDQVLDTLLEAI